VNFAASAPVEEGGHARRPGAQGRATKKEFETETGVNLFQD
jgi:hypothetical protein